MFLQKGSALASQTFRPEEEKRGSSEIFSRRSRNDLPKLPACEFLRCNIKQGQFRQLRLLPIHYVDYDEIVMVKKISVLERYQIAKNVDSLTDQPSAIFSTRNIISPLVIRKFVLSPRNL